MLKSIKKTINFLLIVVAVLLLTSVVFAVVLKIPAVQSYIASGVARYISHQINSTVSVGNIEFSFFNKLIVNKILIEDQHKDTLLYAPKIVVGIRYFNLKKGVIRLGKASITNPEVAFVTDSSGIMNLNWYLEKLSSPKDSISALSGSSFSIDHVELTNGKFALIDRRGSKPDIPLDFSKLIIDSIYGTVDNFEVADDSVSLEISDLKFREKSGLRVRNFTGNLLLEGNNIIFTDINLICDSSKINAPRIALLADSASSFGNFEHEVRFDIDLDRSLITASDLKYFVPFIKDLNDSIWLSGEVTGTVSELKGRNIRIKYKNETNLDLDFDLSGLPDLSNTFIFLEINDFRSISNDIEQINIPGKGNILLPEALRKLGVVSFSGTFTGFTTDFVTYGKINTNKGLISTDISLRPTGDNNFRIKGLLKGTDIDLGDLTGNPEFFGKMTAEANVDGTTNSFKTLAVNVSGRIDSVEMNSYIYRNITLNGYFKDKAWDGNIRIDDRNIKLDLLGMFDFNRELPEFDFTLNLRKADLYMLHFDRSDTSARASLLLTANFKGNSIDNLDGEIKLLNSSFRKYSSNLEIYDFSLRTFLENSRPAIALRTDFIDASLNGHYSFAGLRDVVKGAMAELVPAKFGEIKTVVRAGENDFVFDIRFKNTDGLNKFLKTGMLISAGTTISGIVRPPDIVSVTCISKIFSVNDNVFRDLEVKATYGDSLFNTNITSKLFNLSGFSDLKDLKLDLALIPDHFDIGLFWDNKEKVINKGSFQANGDFRKSSGTAGMAVLTINLLPGEIVNRNNQWKLNPANIIVDSTAVKISSFSISNGNNSFILDGAVSENTSDTLYMKFNGIDISPVNNLYEKSQGNSTEIIPLSLGGTINGSISLTDLYRNFMFESDIIVKDFTILQAKYGDIKIGSIWNNNLKVAEINASNNLNGIRMFDIRGFYDPDSKKVNLNAVTEKLPIDFLNPLLQSFASGISGNATGKINFSGEFAKPVLTGSVWGENATLKIDYLQTKYKFNDSISFDKSGIKFHNIQLKDEKGNSAILTGAVYHKYFQDWGVDITLKSTESMVLNTRQKDNDLFYGTAYATGVTTIRTAGNLLKFDISAKTGKNTRIFIPLNSGMSVSENTFVTFVPPATDVGKDDQEESKKNTVSTSTALDITIDLEITPDAEIQLIMDPKVGDIIKGTGTGNLNIRLNPKGEFNIFGDYTIEDGDYLFTLGSLVNKEFSVESGGTITFNGNVENADIEMKAIYKTKASLYDIMPDLMPESKQSERIPVECQLLLSGKLFNPVVGFNIYLPTANEATRAYLKSMINSDEEMSRQFLFLLVMNRFYTEQSTGSQPVRAGMGSETVGVTTMEMVSNQVSNWLSQISNDFDIGVNYRPGSSTLPNSQELQVALSTQILNDRVKINGNFDVAGSQATGSSGAPTGANSITGAFDIEYSINDKIKFKFFNRSNDNFYMDNGILYTQGIGIFYRQDFNKFKDLFKKRQKSDLKKEDETKAGK